MRITPKVKRTKNGYIILESDIRGAMKVTQSNLQAAKYLGVSYNTYKKWAESYIDNETGKTLLELQKELLDPDARQHALYRLYINPTFRKLIAGFAIVSFIHILLYFFATTLSTPGRNVFSLFLLII